MYSRFFRTLAALALFCAAVYGQQPARDRIKEKTIWQQLGSVAPAAVDAFGRGTAAMDKGHYRQAADLYREVARQAPAFSPALRRRGFRLAGLGQTGDAVATVERAVKIERSLENLISLAQMLAYPAQGKQFTQAQEESAFTLAQETNERYHGVVDSSYPTLVAQLALELRKQADFGQATETPMQKFPGLMTTHYFQAIRSAMDEDWMRG